MKRIGVLTSGGDAPGMNAAIRSVVRAGLTQGVEVYGIKRGYAGLLNREIFEMKTEDVSEIIQKGGTVLFTARCEEFTTLEGQKKGAEILREFGIDGLVVIGGDGSFRGAGALSAQGINVVGVPATIDLDIASTEYTIGFDTAVNTAIEAIDKIRDTSTAHERVSIVEVMGRKAGYLALCVGIAVGAEDILLPERYNYEKDQEKLIDHVIRHRKKGKRHHLIINAEGVGNSEELAKSIEKATGIETRATVLGYLQRGGSPTFRDRFIATEMGVHAVDLLIGLETNRVVVYREDGLADVDMDEALSMRKPLDPNWLRVMRLMVRK